MSVFAQVGLQVLLDAGHVFQCHPTLKHVIYHSELGSAKAIFEAGYTIDSLMLRYQGVNWSDTSNWDCNQKYAATSYCKGKMPMLHTSKLKESMLVPIAMGTEIFGSFGF